MRNTEQAAILAAKMYERRAQIKRLLGSEYPARVAQYKAHLRAAMQKWGLEAGPAALRLSQGLQERGASEITVALVIAAFVEICEEK